MNGLERLSASQTRVTYQLQADPGASTPSCLANAGAMDTQLNSIKNLREFAE